MRTIRIQGMNPVNSFTFPSNKTATQSHSQANMLFWLDFLCDNLVYPCNTPPSVDEWLPEKHLARFVVEVIDGLDLRVMRGSYRGSGSASYPPSLLLGILVYGYACSRAASWSGRPMTRSRSSSSRPTS